MNGAHASVAVTLAANTPWACRVGVSLVSMSLLFPGVSEEVLEFFFTQLSGLAECELSCAAAAAPAPAGPWAETCSAPNVQEIEKPKSSIVPTKIILLIPPPHLKTQSKITLSDRAFYM